MLFKMCSLNWPELNPPIKYCAFYFFNKNYDLFVTTNNNNWVYYCFVNCRRKLTNFSLLFFVYVNFKDADASVSFKNLQISNWYGIQSDRKKNYEKHFLIYSISRIFCLDFFKFSGPPAVALCSKKNVTKILILAFEFLSPLSHARQYFTAYFEKNLAYRLYDEIVIFSRSD